MKLAKSPGAVAAHGALGIDQLGKVGQENSLRILAAQPPRPRASNATRCVCGSAIVIDREVSGALTTSGVTFKPTKPPPRAIAAGSRVSVVAAMMEQYR
jgi:hypothetical protein